MKAKIHQKRELAEDEAELAELKEALLEDEEAQSIRQRRFRWALDGSHFPAPDQLSW